MLTRRLFLPLLLLLAFVLGGGEYAPPAAGTAQVDQSDGASVEAASMSGMCNECGDADQARPPCPPVCNSVQAVFSEGAAVSTDIAATEPKRPTGEHISGRAVPPDPHPPKRAFLS